MSSSSDSKKIIIGRIGDAYGVQGWSHIFSFTDPADNLFEYKNWHIRAYQKKGAPWRAVELEYHKPHGAAFVAKIKGYDDRDQALLLKNHSIAVDRSEIPTLKENEYYWNDLIGLQVINTQGESFGEIDHLFEAGPNDIIATKIIAEARTATSKEKSTTHYIPYTKDVVKSVDLEKKIMIVEWETLTDH
jgi:16S rRNA processing protein RimM